MSEIDRLVTFGSWPKDHPIDSSSLARSGFIYRGIADEIECTFCKFRIRDIRDKEVLRRRHFEEKPDCPYNRLMYGDQTRSPAAPSGQSSHREVRPVPNTVVTDGESARPKPRPSGAPRNISTADLISGSQAHPEDDTAPVNTVEADTVMLQPPRAAPNASHGRVYDPNQPASGNAVQRGGSLADEENRVATFHRWPKSHIVHPKDLARAGLYYMGPDDYVQCHFCKGVLHNWVAGDKPLIEHRKHFPTCPFAANKTNIEPQKQNTSGTGISSTLLNHPVVAKALSMGFPTETVISVVQHRIDSSGHNFETPEELIEVLLQGDDPPEPGYDIPPDEELMPWQFSGRHTPIDESEMNYFSEPEPPRVVPPTGHQFAEQMESTSSEEPVIKDEATLAAENEKLKEERVCRICYDRERDIAFIPCGHLVVCATCAFSVKTCPVCRQLILSTLRIFK